MPWHLGHAPNGELNENERGSSSSVSMSCSLGQAIRSENRICLCGSLASRSTRSQHDQARGEVQRGLDRVGEPALRRRLRREPVDDDLDRVLLLLVELRRAVDHVGELDRLAVDPGPAEPLRLQAAEQLDVLPLAAADDRREHLEAGALLELQDAVDDLLRGLSLDRCAALGAVRPPGAGIEQPEVVVDLGDGADRRARVLRRGLLVDGDRGAQALDEVDVGLVHLARGTGGRTPRATRRSGAGPRRRWCRRRGSTCPSPRDR